jgi:hypothetical protein
MVCQDLDPMRESNEVAGHNMKVKEGIVEGLEVPNTTDHIT